MVDCCDEGVLDTTLELHKLWLFLAVARDGVHVLGDGLHELRIQC